MKNPSKDLGEVLDLECIEKALARVTSTLEDECGIRANRTSVPLSPSGVPALEDKNLRMHNKTFSPNSSGDIIKERGARSTR